MKTVTIVDERCGELLPLSACGTSGWEPLLRCISPGGPFVVHSTNKPLRLDPSAVPTVVTFRKFVLIDGPGEGIAGESDRELTATHIDVGGERYEPVGLNEWGRQMFEWVPKNGGAMMTEREISEAEVEATRDDPAVVEVEGDNSPDEVADKFVEALARIGVDVEVLVPPDDYPVLFYRITRNR